MLGCTGYMVPAGYMFLLAMGLRSFQSSLSPDGEAAAHKAKVEVRFVKKITTRHEWLESLTSRICDAMGLCFGLNTSRGCFGHVGHNGVAVVGPLGAALSGYALLCGLAESALITSRCDKNAWANGYCNEVFWSRALEFWSESLLEKVRKFFRLCSEGQELVTGSHPCESIELVASKSGQGCH